MALTKIPASLLDTASGLDLQGNITLGDNEQIQLGADGDLAIYHTGTESWIKDAGSGNLYIDSNGAAIQLTSGNAAKSMINAVPDGGVTLFHNNNIKLNTSSTGVTVTGVLTATSVNTGQGDYELYAMDQNVRTTDSPAFAAATINGTLTVTGNLDITGDINSYNVTDLDVTDKTITLGAGQTEANSGGSGIIIDGSNASILWNETGNRFDLSNDLKIGAEDGGQFSLEISGGSTGTTEGGELRLNTAADYDGTYNHYRLDVYEDDFRIGRAGYTDLTINSSGNATFGGSITSTGNITTTGAFKSGGANNYILFDYDGDFTGGDYYTIQDTSANRLRISYAFSATDNIELDSSGNFYVNGGNATFAGSVTAYSTIHATQSANDALLRATTTGAGAYVRLDSTTSGYYGIQMHGGNPLVYKWFIGSYGTNDFTIKSEPTGTEFLRVTTGGNVGIGTGANPAEKFHVSGGNVRIDTDTNSTLTISDGGTDAINLLGGTGDELYIGANAAYKLRFKTDGNIVMDNGGNLGIGTSSPDDMLDVENGNIRLRSNADGNTGLFRMFDAAGTEAGQIYPASGDLKIYSPNDVLFTPSGNVGIGTTSPSTRLEINDNSTDYLPILTIRNNSTGAYGGKIDFQSNISGTQYSAASLRASGFSGAGTGKLFIGVGGSELFEFHSGNGGRFVCGDYLHFSSRTDSSFIKGDDSTGEISYYADQNHKFYVYEGGWKNTVEVLSTGQVRFQGDQTEGNGGYLSSWDDNSGIFSGGGYQTQSGFYWTSNRTSFTSCDSGQILFYANYTGTAGQVNSVTLRAKINDSSNSGDFYTNDGSVSSLSDSRLKTNIENLTDGLDILTQLRPVTFEYNDNSVDERGREQLGKADGITRYGFIAQEVESVAPQYVNTETGMIGGEEVDDLKSMSQTRLIPMLVKSIQELKTELDAAKARITELEG